MKTVILLFCSLAAGLAQYYPPGTGATPGGAAGGDLSGTYPNPTVAQLNGVAAASYVVGATNLGTTGYVPYVSASGTLSIGSTANKDLYYDVTNGRLGIGCSGAPVATLQVCGSSGAAMRVRNTASTGYVDIATGNASLTGYMAWFLANNTRNGYMGNDNGAGITLNIENGGTFKIINPTASTGATRVAVQLGAADSATTATVTNAGTTKSAGYQSSDGTAGVTGTTCVALSMQVKNGLVVAGCT